MRFNSIVKQFEVIIAMNSYALTCHMNGSYVVGQEQASDLCDSLSYLIYNYQ